MGYWQDPGILNLLLPTPTLPLPNRDKTPLILCVGYISISAAHYPRPEQLVVFSGFTERPSADSSTSGDLGFIWFDAKNVNIGPVKNNFRSWLLTNPHGQFTQSLHKYIFIRWLQYNSISGCSSLEGLVVSSVSVNGLLRGCDNTVALHTGWCTCHWVRNGMKAKLMLERDNTQVRLHVYMQVLLNVCKFFRL